MIIRFAVPHDSPQIVNLLIHSITHGCVQDHNNDKTVLDNWLLNKTDENILKWIDDPNNITIVSEEESKSLINGVGLVSKSGMLLLLYISPDSERLGIATQIFKRLQSELVKLGTKELTVHSTKTARFFYEKQGCILTGKPSLLLSSSIPSYPMSKSLS
jgi:N-acetylglutamate synthase-like GNAT family acetyltransferase